LAFLEGLAYLALHRDRLPAMASEVIVKILGQAQGMVGFAKANDKLDVVKDLAGVIRVAGDMIDTTPTRTGFVALRRDIERRSSKCFQLNRLRRRASRWTSRSGGTSNAGKPSLRQSVKDA
jgi:hypothetical protein